jgi:hypothetical protein
VKGKVVHPEGVVILDGEDPYFVVAADKGTATFSDVANAIALERGFWLGDAFASGGSVGYDHKAMGITAKGGWVSSSGILPKWASMCRKNRCASWAAATCRATCSAMACCCPKRSSSSPPSTTATSSSIPIPIRRQAGRNARAVQPAAFKLGGL